MGIGSMISSGALGTASQLYGNQQNPQQPPQSVGGKGAIRAAVQPPTPAQPSPAQPSQVQPQPAQEIAQAPVSQSAPQAPQPEPFRFDNPQTPQPMGGKGGGLGGLLSQQVAQQQPRFDFFRQRQGFFPNVQPPAPPQLNPYAQSFNNEFASSEAGRAAAGLNAEQQAAAQADFDRARGITSTPTPPIQAQPQMPTPMPQPQMQMPSQMQQQMMQQYMAQQMFRGLGGKGGFGGGMRNPYAGPPRYPDMSYTYKDGGNVKK